MATLALAMDRRLSRGAIEGKGQTISRFELMVDLREIVRLHLARGCRTAEPHGSHHSKSAGDPVVATSGVIVKGSEGGFGDSSHFVGNCFDE